MDGFFTFLNFVESPGHQQLIINVSFSPDSRLIASASFDKSVKLWDAKTGKSVLSLKPNSPNYHHTMFPTGFWPV